VEEGKKDQSTKFASLLDFALPIVTCEGCTECVGDGQTFLYHATLLYSRIFCFHLLMKFSLLFLLVFISLNLDGSI
jgi:hypothetical protein